MASARCPELTEKFEGFYPYDENLGEKETNTCYMPTGQKIVPDEYLALHSNEVICSLLVTPNAPHRPWLIVGTNEGDVS